MKYVSLMFIIACLFVAGMYYNKLGFEFFINVASVIMHTAIVFLELKRKY